MGATLPILQKGLFQFTAAPLGAGRGGLALQYMPEMGVAFEIDDVACTFRHEPVHVCAAAFLHQGKNGDVVV